MLVHVPKMLALPWIRCTSTGRKRGNRPSGNTRAAEPTLAIEVGSSVYSPDRASALQVENSSRPTLKPLAGGVGQPRSKIVASCIPRIATCNGFSVRSRGSAPHRQCVGVGPLHSPLANSERSRSPCMLTTPIFRVAGIFVYPRRGTRRELSVPLE